MWYLKSAPGKSLLYKPSQKFTVEGFSDADWASSRSDRMSTFDYCTFVGDNLVTWRIKKQIVVARSSAEAGYHAMAHTTSEMMWVSSLLHEIWFIVPIPTKMYYDINQPFSSLVTRYFISAQSISKLIAILFMIWKNTITLYVRSEDQLGDILTKPLAIIYFLFM